MTDAELFGSDVVYVPITPEIGLDAGWWPWLAPDPNPMPEVICSDALDLVLYGWDRTRTWWFEARCRFVERMARLLRVGR